MNLPPPKVCRTIRSLFARLDSSHAPEAANARDKLAKLLAKHGLKWADIPACIAAADADDNAKAPRSAPTNAGGTTDKPQINVLDLVLRLLELHLALIPEQRMAMALWTLHSHVFSRYLVTPRLAFVSPVRGCGKTTGLILLETLTADPYRSDNVTAAAIFHTLAYREHTLCSTKVTISACSTILCCARCSTPDIAAVVPLAGLSVVDRASFRCSPPSQSRRSACCRCH